MLIVISGPIASGKSAVARALAQEFAGRGRSAARIDLDIVYEMLEHSTRRKDDDAKWLAARRAAAALTDAFLTQGTDVVIVEGEFLTLDDREAYVRWLRTDAQPYFVTLTVSVEEAVRRADADASRTVSRGHGFLNQHYAAVQAALEETPSTDLLLDTERLTAGEAARVIARWADRPSL